MTLDNTQDQNNNAELEIELESRAITSQKPIRRGFFVRMMCCCGSRDGSDTVPHSTGSTALTTTSGTTSAAAAHGTATVNIPRAKAVVNR